MVGVSLSESEIDVADVNDSQHDSSHRRKRTLVEPNSNRLGKKHSSIDVHQCASATCRICAYRPADVAFVASPTPPPAMQTLDSKSGSKDDSLGGTAFV